MKKKSLIAAAVIISMIGTMVLTGCGTVYDYDDMSKYITVGEYKGLEYNESELVVTDSEVKDKIKETVDDSATTETFDSGKVEDGDTIIIDYKGTMDDKALKGAEQNDFELKIGSNAFIKGFESGLIGKEIGDDVTLDLTFPEDYSNKDLASKPVQFDVKIKEKKVTTTYEYNDEWVKKHTDCSTTAEFDKQVKANLQEEKKAKVGTSLIEKLAEKAEVIEYPEKEMKIGTETMRKKAKAEAKTQKITLHEWYKKMGVNTDEDFDNGIKETVQKNVKNEMVAYYIAQKEGLVATSGDVKDYYDSYLRKFGITEEKFEDDKGEDVEDYVRNNIDSLTILMTTKNVADFLVDNGKAK